jgi:hypothetical protein
MTTQATAQKRKKAAREAEGKAEKARQASETELDETSTDDAHTDETKAASRELAAEAAASITGDSLAVDVTTQGALSDEQTRLAWIIGLSLGTLGTVLAGLLLGPPIAVLVLAGTAAASVIALFWQSLRTLIGEAPLSAADTFAAFSTGTEQEQKRAVLRAMKDLEYERNVGKISEEDFKRLILRYRTEAKSLLRRIDERSAGDRAKAEKLVETRLRAAGLLHLTPPPAEQAEAEANETLAAIEAPEARAGLQAIEAPAPADAAPALATQDEDASPPAAARDDEANDADASNGDAPRATEAKT